MNPIHKISYHKSAINDAKFHPQHSDLFLLTTEDAKISFWDIRKPLTNPIYVLNEYPSEVFSVDFNPSNEFLFLSSFADGLIGLWDMRNLKKVVYSFDEHTDKCTKVRENVITG